MSKPLFADRWYELPIIRELRQEVQNIYHQLTRHDEEQEEQNARLSEAEQDVASLEAGKVSKAGDTMSGPLEIVPPGSSNTKVLDFDLGYAVHVDNVSATAADNTRLWLDTPALGEVVIGGRFYSSRLDYLRLRANQVVIDSPIYSGASGNPVLHAKTYLETGILEDWTEATLLNSWVHYQDAFGGSWPRVGYWRDPLGIVHLRGLARHNSLSTPATSVVFNLPSGYRPPADVLTMTFTNGGITRLNIKTNGDVQLQSSPGVGYVTFDNIHFRL